MFTSDISTLTQQHDSIVLIHETLDKTSPMSSEESKDGSERSALRTPPSDTSVSDYQPGKMVKLRSPDESYNMEKLLEMFSETIIAKTLRVAIEALKNNVQYTSNQKQYIFIF